MAQLDRVQDPTIQRNFEQLQKNIKDQNIAADAKVRHSKILTAILQDKTVGTSEVTIAHGLGVTPYYVGITMKSAGTIRLSSATTRPTTALWYDAVNVYVIADAAARVADIVVHG